MEERRAALEKYLQTVPRRATIPPFTLLQISQDVAVFNGETFTSFMKSLLLARHSDARPVELPIFLVNGNKVFLSCLTTDQTDDIFEVARRTTTLMPLTHRDRPCAATLICRQS